MKHLKSSYDNTYDVTIFFENTVLKLSFSESAPSITYSSMVKNRKIKKKLRSRDHDVTVGRDSGKVKLSNFEPFLNRDRFIENT